MKTRALFESKHQNWKTPKAFFAWLDDGFRFTIDAAAERSNRMVPRFWSRDDDAFRQNWSDHRWYLNPEYSSAKKWMAQARRAAMHQKSLGAVLVPARPDTQWWRHFVMQEDGRAGELLASRYVPASRVHWFRWEGLVVGVYFHDKRLKFGEPPGKAKAGESAPFPSAVVMYFHPHLSPPTDHPLFKGFP